MVGWYELLFEGYSLQRIGESIGCHKSTIYRELSQNSTKLGYRPDFASQQYLLRRRYKPSKIDRDECLQSYESVIKTDADVGFVC